MLSVVVLENTRCWEAGTTVTKVEMTRTIAAPINAMRALSRRTTAGSSPHAALATTSVPITLARLKECASSLISHNRRPSRFHHLPRRARLRRLSTVHRASHPRLLDTTWATQPTTPVVRGRALFQAHPLARRAWRARTTRAALRPSAPLTLSHRCGRCRLRQRSRRSLVRSAGCPSRSRRRERAPLGARSSLAISVALAKRSVTASIRRALAARAGSFLAATSTSRACVVLACAVCPVPP